MPDHIGGIKLDWTINITTLVGAFLIVVGFVITVTQIQSQNDKRLSLLEERAKTQVMIDSHQDTQTAESLNLIRESQRRIETKLDRIIEREANK